ncbi:MAG: shikimate dehydrogenase [Chloroflexota bacterium]|nr:shikimate dehydrogenase [Chloroflexota bacterium]
MTSHNNPALQPQTRRTMIFIGVTTGSSAMMHVFPRWSDVWGLDAQLIGYDAPLRAPAETYRDIVEHIKQDPLIMGALVTAHKIDLLNACGDLFDDLDPYAQLTGEVSGISKRNGKLIGHARDPVSSGLAWEAFVPAQHFVEHEADVLCLGGGGAASAISVYAATADPARGRPRRLIIVDISQERLDHIRAIHENIKTATPLAIDYILNSDPQRNDTLMAALPPGSLVINATGLGKDRPGSPITDAALFPHAGLVWEINYRGALDFMQQARRQAAERQLIIEDGWVYFVHGWSQVVSVVFDAPLTPDIFAQLDAAASSARG